MIGRIAVALSTTLLVMTTISVAGAFSSPPTPTASCAGSGFPNMRRSAIHARLLWRNAIPSFRPSFNLVRESIEEEDIQKEVLENAIESILYNKGFDRVVGSALHSIQLPHSALPSLSNLHPHLHLPVHVTAHAIAAALPATALDLASIENLLATLPVWAWFPGVALLAAGALPPHMDASASSSIVPLRRRKGTIERHPSSSEPTPK